MKRFMVVAVMAGAMCIAAAGAQGASFTNGSFEQGAIDPGAYATLAAGNTSLTGWSIYSGSIDWIGTYWTAAAGIRSIDLNGTAPGGMYQGFDTVAGTPYRVTFALAGNPDGFPTVKSLAVWAKNESTGDALGGGGYSFNSAGTTKTGMGWTEYSFLFTAASNRSLLELDSTTTFPTFTIPPDVNNTNPFGPALDNMRVDAVPVTGTLVLFGSGLLGLIGIGRRRFRK